MTPFDSSAVFDPIALCLVRELVESDEALNAVRLVISRLPENIILNSIYGTYCIRRDDKHNLAQALLSHLLIIPCPQIDTSAYERLWQEALKLPEDERENGKLWDAVEDVAQRVIALYRGMK